MLRNYLKIAIRLITRNKLISTINILGMALALTGSLLIAVFVHDELSYDRHHENAAHIYRVTRNFLSSDGSVSLHLGLIAPPFGPLLKNDFPDIIAAARTRGFYQRINIEKEGGIRENLDIQNPYLAEPAVFQIFTIPILAGDAKTGLEKPFTMMVSDETAKKYFGTLDVVGKRLRSGDFYLEITGVYQAFPAQSHWHPDILVSFSTLNDDNVYGRNSLETNWGNNNFSTYILVNDQFDPAKVAKQFPAFLDKHMGKPEEPTQPSSWTNLFLQPLTAIHLHSHLDYEIEANGSIYHVYTMSAIGIFLVLIACFNFINLSTARATKRGKEVGLRKVAGAYKKQLVSQYLSESILIAFLSFLIALVFTTVSLPWLNDFTGKSIELSDYVTLNVILVAAGIIVLIGIMAGLYPAFVISGFKPALILKGQNGSVNGGSAIRKTLVVLQFSISIIMIIATLITYQQLTFLNQRELGYAKDQVVTLVYDGEISQRYDAFFNELTNNPAILDVSRSSKIPTGRLLDYQGSFIMRGDSLAITNISIKDVRVDHNFFTTYQVPIVSGRNFSKEIKTDDSLAFIINEAAAKMVGWTNEEAVGQVFKNGPVLGRIIGVVKDFHFESLHEPIIPVVFHGQNRFNTISVCVSEAEMKAALAHIEKVWKEFAPNAPFTYGFLSERYNNLYESEQSQNELFFIFAGLAIFIASIGLFGLATFNAQQRNKEVSIRKVLGASVASILQLLSKEILVLILIANMIAWPVAWYFMNEWLNEFAYHIEMNIFTYLGAGILAMVITLITIGSQTMKSALTNPATILRNE